MGFLGILEPKSGEHVPGTVVLDDQAAHSEGTTSNLKHASGKSGNIILIPQPSNDPNDPLNWSQTKKLTCMLIVGFGSCVYGATIPPLLNAGTVVIAMDLGVSIPAVIQASGYQVLVVAGSATIVNAISRKFGKRPVFLASCIFGLVGSAVGSASQNYSQLLTARIIQGFSCTAYESLLLAIVGDLFFLHERGTYSAFANFILGAVSNFSSVICGPITTNLGWRWLFHLLLILGSLIMVLHFLFVPETQYNRDRAYELDETGIPAATLNEKVDAVQVEDVGSNSGSNSSIKPKTYVQSLAIFTGKYSNENFFMLCFGPFATCLNLAVLWVIILSGYYLSLFVTVAYLLAQLFSPPPYLLTASGVGYLSLGPFLGGLLAAVVSAFINDPLVRWCAKRNKGVYEPEYRLLIAHGGLIGIAGFIGFGFAAQNYESYFLTAFCHGMGLFGLMFLFISSTNYALDSFREMSNEIFLASMAFKNLIIFAYAYFINDWAAREGPAQVLYVLGAVGAGLMITTPVLFIFGKRYRLWWHKHNLVQKLGIVTHAE
ncbi:MFS transporter-like protein 30 [Elsinoe australis]|uniref:MFS transporter-like protein 30 n=1 Tax=Elsinoe australis TaxID=40998 RepID=A0A2P7ZZV7_9PEZI|nr:hypothetical protein B9Z65_7564 [Elsinoe australis]TKX25765.1 MFS transporter-like protein 30 [Elsinoe australis]